MYAVIETGGKQHRVTEGQRLDIERVRQLSGDDEQVIFEPRLLVDDGRVVAGAKLAGAQVAARVIGQAKGPKIRGFKYRPKARTRRRWGHRQGYSTIEIVSITSGSG